MSSFLTELMNEVAAEVLEELHGDRDEEGLVLGEYRTGIVEDEVRTWPGSVTKLKFEDVPNSESGALERKETRTWKVRRALVDEDEIEGFQRDATVTIRGEEWALSEPATEWGDAFVTFGLIRQPLVRKYEGRASV